MAKPKPNVVLIVMDAVRALNTSLYGYGRETTPNLKEISEKCVFYENATSSSYWTLPSIASLFTGTYVSKHSLIMDGDLLGPQFTTMAEILRKEGYRTFGFARNNPYISHFTGLDRGFEVFHGFRQKSVKTRLYELLHRDLIKWKRYVGDARACMHDKKNPTQEAESMRGIFQWIMESKYLREVFWIITSHFDKSAATVNECAKELIRKPRNSPFFLYIHYDEAHMPYVMPRTFREKFIPAWLKRRAHYVNQDYRKYYSGAAKMDKLDFQILKMLYDGAIVYLDLKIYEIYQFLERQDLLDDTMFIITSDHGDSLGEHGIMFHVFCLYDTLIRIPLLIKYPAEMDFSGIDDRMVQIVDIFPTIIDTIGITNKTLYNQIQGNSLAARNGHLRFQKRSFQYAVSELAKPFGPSLKPLKNSLENYDRQLISIRTRDAKYIYSSNGKDEFYDLQKDPEELNNLISSQDPRIFDLKEKLTPWLRSFINLYERKKCEIEGESKAKFDEEIKERLQQLGYI